ncbi:MAG: hypothetical protein KDG89_01210 [Geminicoccaceae bacterium]|nr:hypothetical protein [Geminicoccaceae bacterium]
MAWFTTLQPKRVGLVDIFRNPVGREWLELQALADPIDGIRGYVVGGDFYGWGSLPLHRDLRRDLQAELPDARGGWIGVQVMPLLRAVSITEALDGTGEPVPGGEVVAALSRCLPLVRLLGQDFLVTRLGEATPRPVAAAR